MNLSNLLEIAIKNLGDLSKVEDPDFRLEQAEFDENDNSWEIIVSYLVDNTNKKPLSSAIAKMSIGYEYYRIYKRLVINSEGEMLGFYIYDKK